MQEDELFEQETAAVVGSSIRPSCTSESQSLESTQPGMMPLFDSACRFIVNEW